MTLKQLKSQITLTVCQLQMHESNAAYYKQALVAEIKKNQSLMLAMLLPAFFAGWKITKIPILSLWFRGALKTGVAFLMHKSLNLTLKPVRLILNRQGLNF